MSDTNSDRHAFYRHPKPVVNRSITGTAHTIYSHFQVQFLEPAHVIDPFNQGRNSITRRKSQFRGHKTINTRGATPDNQIPKTSELGG